MRGPLFVVQTSPFVNRLQLWFATARPERPMMTETGRRVLPGQPSPLGATLTDEGVNFAVYSEASERLELCLFDTPDGEAVETIPFFEKMGYIWHCLVP